MHKGLYFLLTFLCLSITNFAQTIIIDDDLQGNTSGTLIGGSFTAEGYQPGTGFNHILYDVPAQISSGYVEFEMKGFAPSLIQDPNGGDDTDNGFIGMYDGRGVSEPCQYFYDFRENFFRWNFHWRQSRDAVKSVVNCAAPTSARLNAATAVFTDQNSPVDANGNPIRDWLSEPTGDGYSFNSSTWYTVRLDWKDKNFKVTINGTTVWEPDIAEDYDYAPKDFKIWLGCAPGHTDKYGNWVAGVVFRNFKVVSYGTPSGSPPSAPSSLDADAAGSSQINLSWTDNANDEDGFKIEMKTGSSGSWSEITSVGSDVTTYQNTGLNPSTTYYYKL